jgi:hypothetical protein
MTVEKSVHETTTEEAIANAAWALAGDQHDRVIAAYQIEMIRRNNVALRAFTRARRRPRWRTTLRLTSDRTDPEGDELLCTA